MNTALYYTPIKAQRELVLSDLYEFVKYFWDTFEPFPFMEAEYIEFLCECVTFMSRNYLPESLRSTFISDEDYEKAKQAHYERTGVMPVCDVRDKKFRGKHVNNHNINIHPRAGKSLIVNVCEPVWSMLHSPIMTTSVSHSQDLSREFIDKKRKLLNSEKFQKMFPEDDYRLVYDSSTLVEMQNLGKSYSVSMKSFTGRGSHKILNDDLCFTGRTRVLMSSGACKRIKDLKVGDSVISYNHSADTFEEDTVVATRVSYSESIAKIRTDTGNTVSSTADHKYWVEHRGYTPIHSVEEGEVFKSAPTLNSFGEWGFSGKCPILVKKSIRARRCRVYDIQVLNNSNFFANGLLVHNCNVQDARADGKILQSAKDYIRYTQSTRLNDPQTGITAHIMQRICKGDVSDMITSDPELSKLYSNTILRAIVEEEEEAFIFPVSGRIWHRPVGDCLAKKRFGDYSLERMKLGEIDFQCQFQQNVALSGINIISASDIEESTISREAFEKVNKITHYASHDCPVKDKETSDKHGYVEAWADEFGTLYITDAMMQRMSFVKEQEFMVNLETIDPSILQVVEDKANGSILLQNLAGALTGLIPFEPGTRSKMARLELAQVYLAQGRVKFVKSDRVDAFCLNLQSFPTVANDDDVDAFTQLVLTHFTQKNTFIYTGVFTSQNIETELHETEYPMTYYGVTESKGVYYALEIRHDQHRDIFTVVSEHRFMALPLLSDFLKGLPPGTMIYDCSVNQQIINLTQFVFGMYEFDDQNILVSTSIIKGGFAKNKIRVLSSCSTTILDIMRWRSPNKEFKNLLTDFDVTTERVARCVRGVVTMVKGNSNFWM